MIVDSRHMYEVVIHDDKTDADERLTWWWSPTSTKRRALGVEHREIKFQNIEKTKNKQKTNKKEKEKEIEHTEATVQKRPVATAAWRDRIQRRAFSKNGKRETGKKRKRDLTRFVDDARVERATRQQRMSHALREEERGS
jgi:hypothetical protein